MKHIIYAIQDKSGAWTGFLQKTWGREEHREEGMPRIICPTERTYETEEEAKQASRDYAKSIGVELVEDALDTDYRQGKIDIATNDTSGTDTQKLDAMKLADAAEREKMTDAKAGG
jgi:hypothetical protein